MAYDEVESKLENYKAYAKQATYDLLCCCTKSIVDTFIVRINNATSQAEVSRVMASVRHAI